MTTATATATDNASDQGTTSQPDKPRVTYTCTKCGGKNVLRDAFAYWDEEKQGWMLQSVFDQTVCNDCDEEVSLIEKRLSP